MGAPSSLAEILAVKHAPRAAAIAAARALHNLSIHGGPRSVVIAGGGAAALISRLRAHVGESVDEDEAIVIALNFLSSGAASRAHREAVEAASGAEAVSMALTRHGHRSHGVLLHGTQALSSVLQISSCEKALAAGAIEALAVALSSPLLEDDSATAVHACTAVQALARAPCQSHDLGTNEAARNALIEKRFLAGLVGVMRRAPRSSDAWKNAKAALAAIAEGSAVRRAAVSDAGGGAALDEESSKPKTSKESAAPPRKKQADIDQERRGEFMMCVPCAIYRVQCGSPCFAECCRCGRSCKDSKAQR